MAGAGGFGAIGVSMLNMTTPSNLKAKGTIDITELVKGLNLTDTEKKDFLNKIVGGETDWSAVGVNCLGIAGQVINMFLQRDLANKAFELEEDRQELQLNLAQEYRGMQEFAIDAQKEIMAGKDDLVRDLADKKVELEKYRIKKESDTSIANTKTAASYGYLNSRFYGKPAVSTNRYV